jgi:RND family efflux transporter MFP subunit
MKAQNLIPLSIALIAAAGCVNREAQAQAKETEEFVSDAAVEVSVLRVAPLTSEDVLEVTGQIQAVDTVAVGPVLPGRLTRVFVREGQSVSAGQLLAQQDARDAETQLRQARAQVASAESAAAQARIDAKSTPNRSQAGVDAAEAQLAQARESLAKLEAGARPEERRQAQASVDRAESDLKVAEANRNRFRRLRAEGAVADADVEAAENRYDNALAAYRSAIEGLNLANDAVRQEDIAAARQQVRAAEANLDSARASKALDPAAQERVRQAEAQVRSAREAVKLAQKQVADLEIRAPFAGRVQGRPLQPGTVASPGVAVVNLVGLESAFFEAEIPEARLKSVKIGASVEITVDALEGSALSGRVSTINPSASSVARLFTARIALGSRPDGLKAGMFAKGRILLESVDGAYRVPSEAVLESSEGPYVYVREGEDEVRQVPVKPRKTEAGQAEVLGLSPGDEIVIQGQGKLFPESKVRVAPAQGA